MQEVVQLLQPGDAREFLAAREVPPKPPKPTKGGFWRFCRRWRSVNTREYSNDLMFVHA
jgi:hypothetical protein